MTIADEKRVQVTQQCQVICHLAMILTRIHVDYVALTATGANDKILDVVGPRTASFMEQLGNMLNAMDAADPEDEWMSPIFTAAQRMWPQDASE